MVFGVFARQQKHLIDGRLYTWNSNTWPIGTADAHNRLEFNQSIQLIHQHEELVYLPRAMRIKCLEMTKYLKLPFL